MSSSSDDRQQLPPGIIEGSVIAAPGNDPIYLSIFEQPPCLFLRVLAAKYGIRPVTRQRKVAFRNYFYEGDLSRFFDYLYDGLLMYSAHDVMLKIGREEAKALEEVYRARYPRVL